MLMPEEFLPKLIPALRICHLHNASLESFEYAALRCGLYITLCSTTDCLEINSFSSMSPRSPINSIASVCTIF
jgi:hypothetical protein